MILSQEYRRERQNGTVEELRPLREVLKRIEVQKRIRRVLAGIKAEREFGLRR